MWKFNLIHATLSNGVARPPTPGGKMHAGKGESIFPTFPSLRPPISITYSHIHPFITALRCPPSRVTNTKREMYDQGAFRQVDSDDQDEYITIDPEVPLWDPSLTGGLQRNVSTTFGDAIFSDEVEPEAQQWWLNPPPGGWPKEKKRLLKAKTAPLDYNFIEDEMFHQEWLAEGRKPLSSLKPGDIIKGRVIKTLLREGVQIDVGCEWDGLLPIYQPRSKAAYPPPPDFSALMDLQWILHNWRGLKEQPKLWNQRFRIRKKKGQQDGAGLKMQQRAASKAPGAGQQHNTRHLRVYPPTEGFTKAAKEQFKARKDQLQKEVAMFVKTYIPVDLIAQFRVYRSLLEGWEKYREQWDRQSKEERYVLTRMLVDDGILPRSLLPPPQDKTQAQLEEEEEADSHHIVLSDEELNAALNQPHPELDEEMQQALALFRADLRQELEGAAANGDNPDNIKMEDIDRLVEEIVSEMGLNVDDVEVDRERDEREKRVAESYNFGTRGSSGASGGTADMRKMFPNFFNTTTQKKVAAKASEILASKEFQDYLDWYQFYLIGDLDDHVALRRIWRNIEGRIQLDEEIEVKVHAVDGTGLHRFPIQLAIVDAEVGGMIVPPEEWKPKLNLTNIPTPRWDEMEEYAAGIGRNLYVEREKLKVEMPSFYEEWNEGKRWDWMKAGKKGGEDGGKDAEVVYAEQLRAGVDMEIAEKIVRVMREEDS